MESYQEIRVLPDPEFGTELLMAALFAKLHRALGQYAAGKIGISFPHYGHKPGDIIRLHSRADTLTAFSQTLWLKGLNDHVDVSEIRDVPSGAQHCCFSRVQVKSSAERLRRRSVKKGWMSEEEAPERIPDSKSQVTTLPFIQVKSLSTGEAFRLFIRRGALQPVSVKGEFGAYGLSAVATVPWF
ncbi:CRISPR-associated Csy4 family protein [Rahnella aquatilis CIP 78.65 = ATCC 33071]|uniref:CRISPR-associated protein Cas6/Csy4, subtype I-F/YPEST n=1 Tax=Rahnella aquatilis (strain ATCC 33071 / DSM 4594 / JCM 1683 / NBRC 105701 / NCIMB 13365 / CIP 78.65) TaxID=745277 RepID=H2IUT8_RAHAC|nr:type I-F CRISPR-associated endoribonuclease Cas6/Csy4 [Rahnella aquatilis]AEX51731.1 CRISPR-associated protein Cas6/Csy4, subtype I-F/YPEST [Rahnella aquatilis CIP 78.65 = ATCC 33071]KFD16150.1 CRISPR-associated Csy4 family protein [Rahnella aquatilis CIP 78.65 = ATCC 33071]